MFVRVGGRCIRGFGGVCSQRGFWKVVELLKENKK